VVAQVHGGDLHREGPVELVLDDRLLLDLHVGLGEAIFVHELAGFLRRADCLGFGRAVLDRLGEQGTDTARNYVTITFGHGGKSCGRKFNYTASLKALLPAASNNAPFYLCIIWYALSAGFIAQREGEAASPCEVG
jgi:hypothetical protein